MTACQHGWASENYVKCPRCYDNARHAEEIATLRSHVSRLEESRRVALEARAEAVEVLKECEWDHVDGEDEPGMCVLCGAWESKKGTHRPDCRLARAIGKGE